MTTVTGIDQRGFIHELAVCEDVALVGGKGANLGKLTRAGFPVPGGFVIGTRAFEEAQRQAGGMMPHEIPAEIAEEIVAAYRALGEGPVAVRSSATAEDMAAASMAGQYETFLDVEGEAQLLEKVRHCWASLDTPRIRAYLAEHGIEQARVAMAVVVQKLVPSDVAGVLFTINPNANGQAMKEMVIEASWGLGESVVGGRVQPDVFRLASDTGMLLEAVIADKRVMIAARGNVNGNSPEHAQRPFGPDDREPRPTPAAEHGTQQEIAVEESRRREATLNENDLRQLWELGRRAATHFGVPQDIEWAIHAGRLYMLQSRPITTHQEMQAREEVLTAARAELSGALARKQGPWVVHNLAETLPHPTPLTWSVLRRFMSGSGGFGAMYRMAGFEPSPAVCRDGFLELVAGRIYMDGARAPEMFFENFPFAYDLEELKRSPDASQSPPTLPAGTLKARLAAGRRLTAVAGNLRKLAAEFDRTLREVHVPKLVAYVERHRQTDLGTLTAGEIAALFQQHEKFVLDEFGPLSLLPSMICGMAFGELRTFLAQHLWEEDPDALTQLLSAGGLANRTVLADAELYEVATGDRTLAHWLAEHGHRAPGEFDLATPRWREQPAALVEMAKRLAAGGGEGAVEEKPLERHRRTSAEITRRVGELKARLPERQAAEFDRRMDLVRRYVPFREDGKDYFMLGYDLLRRVAVEAGRRLGVGEGVFYLTREEMLEEIENRKEKIEKEGMPEDNALGRTTLLALIERRKREYRAEGKLSLPSVIGVEAVKSLGDDEGTPTREVRAGGEKAFAVSSGKARGRALVLHSPTELGNKEIAKGYILICPSTDPSWTPLFVNAAGLILECGGTLSHGAVVAREMGLPAAVLPEATRRFKTGDEVIVDGTSGWVGLAADERQHAAAQQTEGGSADPNDTHISYKLVPPPPGVKDRSAGNVRNVMAGVWGVFVLAFFLLPPAWVSQPTLAFLDSILWPLVRSCGKPATVALVATGIALVTLLLQRFLTDNGRLLEAKRRAALLTKEAQGLPADSPRRRALLALAGPVQFRTLMAALVPVGMLLGPMVLPFVWFGARMESATWNAAAGTPVQVVAYVDADSSAPVQLDVPAGLTLDQETPATVIVPAVRPVLEKLLAQYRAAGALAWETEVDRDVPVEQAAADLEAYLKRGIPPQPVRWRITPAKDLQGRLAITIQAGSDAPVTAELAWGDQAPPAAKTINASGAVRQVQVIYDRPNVEPVFFRPLAWLHGGTLAAWDMGWIWLYILAYLPVLFVTRALLRVA